MASPMLLSKPQFVLAGRTGCPKSMPMNLRRVMARAEPLNKDSPRVPPDLQQIREEVSRDPVQVLSKYNAEEINKNETLHTPMASATGTPVSPEDAVAFDGPVPETFNGRMAMLGFTAALVAELTSGRAVVTQFKDAAFPIVLMVGIFGVATIIPYLRGSRSDKSFGPFTPQAELINGRAAMIGIAALLFWEAVRGRALFGM